jgi:hypothetical protein
LKRAALKAKTERKLTAARDFDEVIAELSFDWAVNFPEFRAKNDAVKFRNHLAGVKFSEVTALFAGGALGVLARHFGEICAAFNLFF